MEDDQANKLLEMIRFTPVKHQDTYILSNSGILSHALYAPTHAIKRVDQNNQTLVTLIKRFRDYPCAAVAELIVTATVNEVQGWRLVTEHEFIEMIRQARDEEAEVIEMGTLGTLDELPEDKKIRHLD